jgi:hypothetical protein
MTTQCLQGATPGLPTFLSSAANGKSGGWGAHKAFKPSRLFSPLPAAGLRIADTLAAVPKDEEAAAVVDGMPGIRYWKKGDLALMEQDGIAAYKREADLLAAAGYKGQLPPANFLAVSGGGEDGAFGAGLLCGWTEAGTRPEFKLVTGISTGALTAPFAFLGPKYDEQLKAVYTTITDKDVLEDRGMLAGIMSDALADNAPLKQLVAKYVTADMLKKSRRECQGPPPSHRHDEPRCPPTCDLEHRQDRGQRQPEGPGSGAGNPGGVGRHSRRVPPSMIDVVADGKQYQEMHVDGGASAQVFIYPPSLHVEQISQQAASSGREGPTSSAIHPTRTGPTRSAKPFRPPGEPYRR